MGEKSIANQKVEKTIVVDRKTVKGEMFILSHFYELEEHEFNTLLVSSSDWTDRAKNVFYIGLGTLFSVVSKYAVIFVKFFSAKDEKQMRDLQAKFEISEFIGIGFITIVWLGCYLCSLRTNKGERNMLVEKIKSKYRGQ